MQAVLLHSHTKLTWNELGIGFSILGTSQIDKFARILAVEPGQHCKEEPHSFSHRGSSDHPDLQSFVNLFFGLPNEVSRIWGLVIYLWKGLDDTFPTVYYMPRKL